MSEPVFSIVVPVRNMEQTIARTLDSICRQRYPRREIIIIDGDSSDSTLKQLKPFYADIAQIISEPDSGLYDALNKGIRHAAGDIIGTLNGDDYYAHESVLDLYAAEFDNVATGIVFGDLEFFWPENPEGTIRTYCSAAFEPHMLREGWMPPHPTTFVRKSVYQEVGPYCTSYDISGDFEFLLRALWRKQVAYSRVDSIVVRMQYGGLSTNGLRATWQLNKEIIRACRENGLHTGWWTILRKFPKKLLEFRPLLGTTD